MGLLLRLIVSFCPCVEFGLSKCVLGHFMCDCCCQKQYIPIRLPLMPLLLQHHRYILWTLERDSPDDEAQDAFDGTPMDKLEYVPTLLLCNTRGRVADHFSQLDCSLTEYACLERSYTKSQIL
jgi:hypothetical protein